MIVLKEIQSQESQNQFALWGKRYTFHTDTY